MCKLKRSFRFNRMFSVKLEIVQIMRLRLLLILTISILINIVPTYAAQPIYIAHAGGEIDGYKYTNCLEAVKQSLSSGITHIELDLCMTSDGYLVAAHDWPYFHYITGHKGDSTAITYSEFCSRKIHGKYTPITCFMIDSMMMANSAIFLVTDKISNPDILQKFMSDYKSRVLVECFNINDYIVLDSLGFCKTFYSSEPMTIKKMIKWKILDIMRIKRRPIAERYAFWYYMLGYQYHTKSCFFYKDAGKEYAVFSVDNRLQADSIAQLDERIRYVYIDNVE